MTLQDEFKYLVGGYYGVAEMDEYDLKVDPVPIQAGCYEKRLVKKK